MDISRCKDRQVGPATQVNQVADDLADGFLILDEISGDKGSIEGRGHDLDKIIVADHFHGSLRTL